MASNSGNDLTSHPVPSQSLELRNRKVNRTNQPLNSTTAGNYSEAPISEVSEIRSSSSEDTSYRNNMQSFPTSPEDNFSSQLSSTVQQRRTSEDDLQEPETVSRIIEDIRTTVEWFSIDFKNTENWQSNIDAEYSRIDNKISDFLQKLSLIGDDIDVNLVTLMEDQSKQLSDAKNELQKKRNNEPHKPAPIQLRPSNLSTKLQECTDPQDPKEHSTTQ